MGYWVISRLDVFGSRTVLHSTSGSVALVLGSLMLNEQVVALCLIWGVILFIECAGY